MNDNLISAAYSTFVNKGAMALLIGSGVSRESEIPTGWDVTLKLIRQIGVIHGETEITDPEDWYKDKFGQSPDYSHLLEKLTSSSEERLNLLKPYFEPSREQFDEDLKIRSLAHKYIARLVQDGYIRVIVTTNFDRLIENALKELGIEPVIISNPNHIDSVLPLIHTKITVIKLNGDYLDTGFLNLKGELSKYDERFEPLLCEVFEKFGLITCGWSGKWDTALIEALKSHHKFRFTNFFTYRTEPSTELSDIANFRKGYLIPISDASTFFKELYENVSSLEDLENRHPLTEQLAIQRAKKYVASTAYRVQLADLISDLTSTSFGSINFDFSEAPTSEGVIERLEMCLSRIKPLSATMVQAVYWSEEIHFPIWNNVVLIALQLQSRTNTNNWNNWGDGLLTMPSIILRYAIGISYVASRNWHLLKALHNIVSKQGYEKKNILKLTDPQTAILKSHFKKVGYKAKTPVNQKLYEYFQPLFSLILPTSELYSDAFDLYEIISALMYMKHSEHNLDHGPLSRFCHANTSLWNEIKLQAEAEKDSHFLIVSGLFNSYEELQAIMEEYGKVAFTRALFD